MEKKRTLRKKQNDAESVKNEPSNQCFSFIDDIYKFPVKWCVCGFEYKHDIQLSLHLSANEACVKKANETDINRIVIIKDLSILKADLMNNVSPDADKLLSGIEKLQSVVRDAKFLYSSKFVYDPNKLNKLISEFFILLMGYINNIVETDEQKNRLEKCVNEWKTKFINANIEHEKQFNANVPDMLELKNIKET